MNATVLSEEAEALRKKIMSEVVKRQILDKFEPNCTCELCKKQYHTRKVHNVLKNYCRPCARMIFKEKSLMKRNPWVAPGVRYHDYLNGKWNGYEIVKYNKRFYYYKRDVPDSPIASITAPVFGKPKWMLHKEDLNR